MTNTALSLLTMPVTPPSPSASSRSSIWSGIDRGRVRADWVEAAEASLDIASLTDLMVWLERHVQPLLGYRMVICGTGVFMPRSVNVERLVVRGLRLRDVEKLRNPTGTIVLPRAQEIDRLGVGRVEFARALASPFEARLPDRSLPGKGSSLERLNSTRQSGSFFLFGAPRRTLALPERYAVALLAPHMHDALQRGINEERRGTPPAEEAVRLTRRELLVLTYLAAGLTTSQVARETHRSVHTVANQIRAILQKFNTSKRAEAISRAVALGLLESVPSAPQTRIIAAQQRAEYKLDGKARWQGRYRRTTPARGHFR